MTTTNTIETYLSELETAAQRATQPDWERDGRRIFNQKGTIAECPTPQHGGTFDAEQNAEYIIACSPDRILALVRVARAVLFDSPKADAISAWRKLAEYKREETEAEGLFTTSLAAEMYDKIAEALEKMP